MAKLTFFFAISIVMFQVQASGAARAFVSHSAASPLTIVYYPGDESTVAVAANALAKDMELITGVKPLVVNNLSLVKGDAIIVGTAGGSKFISQMEEEGLINLSAISGQWERYHIRSIRNPFNGIRRALVISGSDKRGAAYGVFHLSGLIGVSPWHWWADVVPERRAKVEIPFLDHTSAPPSVKYRGIFLNDECWGLNPWASNTFEPQEGNIGPATYAAIFELLLRLRGNMIWPAMHPCTNAFYSNPGNPLMADKYGIIVGSSHAEPMLRNNVDEWDTGAKGEFNFFSNRDRVLSYWEERVYESSGFESIYTMGMRGIHDSGMLGAGSMEQRVNGLQEIISEQREMLKRHVSERLEEVPQVFTPFKEVLDIYDAGLLLPDDITVVWPNDTYGYMLRYPDKARQKRAGGHGLYYHFSYWGRPHDYLWLSTTHPLLFWMEMAKAMNFNTNRLWVVNVGDIKPHEHHISLFFDMAWDMSRFPSPCSVREYSRQWYSAIFGPGAGKVIEQAKWEFYQLNFERRAEFMGWSQTEPTRRTHLTEFNHFQAGDEAQRRINRFYALKREIFAARDEVPGRLMDAFFQLVEYPVVAASLMTRKKIYMEKAYLYAGQGRLVANDLARMAREAYDSILSYTYFYNNTMAGGKWRNMMYHAPRDLPVFQMPPVPQWEFQPAPGWGLAVEGDEGIRRNPYVVGPLQLPVFNSLTRHSYFVDLFLKGEGEVEWQALPTSDWITVSVSGGTLSPRRGNKQQRVWVSVDWDKAPPGTRASGAIVFRSGQRQHSIGVVATRPAVGFDNLTPLFVEDNGFVSIHAANFSRVNNVEPLNWSVFNGLGYTGRSVWANPLYDVENQRVGEQGPFSTLEYDFFTNGGGEVTVTVYTLPVHPVNQHFSVRYAVSVNGGKPLVVDHRTTGRSEEWKLNVLRNNAVTRTTHMLPGGGLHVLKIHAVDPGVVIDRVVIDLGGLPRAYSALPETRASGY